MQIFQSDCSPYEVASALSIALEINCPSETLILSTDLEWPDPGRGIVLLDFEDEDGQSLNENQTQLGISRFYHKPFFYIEPDSPSHRELEVPPATRHQTELDIETEADAWAERVQYW